MPEPPTSRLLSAICPPFAGTERPDRNRARSRARFRGVPRRRWYSRGMKENHDIHGDLTATSPSPNHDPKTGKFIPGNGAAPGLGRGASGRTKALRILDAMMAKDENQERLGKALQASFEKNPVKFFRTFVVPLLPKESRVEMANEGKVLWTRISEQFPPVAEE